jgi:hypothetical protein
MSDFCFGNDKSQHLDDWSAIDGNNTCLTPMWSQGRAAIKGDRLDHLAWKAASHGQTECLRVFSNYGVKLNGVITWHAAEGGQMPCLHFAHELGDPLTREAAFRAIVTGKPKYGLLGPECT